VDKLASYKINHLQLHIDHVFGFSTEPGYKETFDVLTPDDIRALDRYCSDRHIDLVTQYICPGAISWSRFAPDINNASENIHRQVRFAKTHCAKGIVITDWDDCGHVNFLPISYHGMALGAALSWNADSVPDNHLFDAALSLHEWDDKKQWLYILLRELGSLCDYHFGNVYVWVNKMECLWNREKEVAGWDGKLLQEKCRRAGEIIEQLKTIETQLPESTDGFHELLWGARGIQWTCALLILKRKYEYGIEVSASQFVIEPTVLLRQTKSLRDEFVMHWRKRNRESGLLNAVSVFDAVAQMVDGWAGEAVSIE
jgi:hypothetical protein